MDSAFLQTLVGVVTQGSIAEAARRQGLSPAAVTLRLKALEAEFGTALVKRSGRTVVATEAGARILARAQRLLRDVEDLRALALDGEMIGQLRIGVIASAASGLLAPMLELFEERHPDGQVLVQRGLSSQLYDAVSRGDLDAALMVEPDFRIPKTCAWQRLNVEPLVLLTSRSLDVVDPHRTLTEEPLIRYGRSHWGGGIADDYLRHVGVVPRERYELDALDSIATLVSRGLGVALVPDWAGLRHEAHPVAKHRLPVAGFERSVGLLWSKSTIRLRHVAALLACATEVLAGLRGSDQG